MSTRKSITGLPPAPLDRRDTQNNRPALSDIPRRLSAGAAWLAGYIVGGEELEAGVTPNLSPRSPMHGLRGHTHSGGLDGRPLFRSVLTLSLDPSNVYSTNLSKNGGQWVVEWSANVTASQSVTYPIGGPIPVFVPGCDLVAGAYRQLGWRAIIRVLSSTNAQTGDVLTLNAKNITTNTEVSDAATTGAPTVATEYYLKSDAAGDCLPCQPGAVNIVSLSMTYTADGTAATRSADVALIEFELGVFSDA